MALNVKNEFVISFRLQGGGNAFKCGHGQGETLVDADYSQIELRILAHITGDEHMQQAFLNGAEKLRYYQTALAEIQEMRKHHDDCP